MVDSEYKTVNECAALPQVVYSAYWIRTLAQQGKIEAVKRTERMWLIHLPSLLDYQRTMQLLGDKKFDPRS